MEPASTQHLGNFSRLIAVVVIALDIAVWYQVVAGRPQNHTSFHFLDVGQGDAEVVEFPGGVQVMTDAGPGRTVARPLERAIGAQDRFIELAIVSHPQTDHYTGFSDLLDRYRFGAFIMNGRADTLGVDQWNEFTAKLAARHIPVITLAAGDRIRYGEDRIDLLSPDAHWLGRKDLNDTGFVERIVASGATALFMADTDIPLEKDIMGRFDLRADILKVAHHGSKYSSSAPFLAAVNPAVAVIEVGKNTYGHPTPATLARLASSTAATVFRTDRNGNVDVAVEGGMLRVFTER